MPNKTSLHTTVLGTNLSQLTIEEALSICLEAIERREALRVCLPYVEPVMAAAQDDNLRRLINQADLVLANGSGLQWAADYLQSGSSHLSGWLAGLFAVLFKPSSLGRELPDRFTSTSFTLPLLSRSQSTKAKLLLVGSPKHGPISDTVRTIQNRYPKLTVEGFDGANFNDEKLQELTRTCRDFQPDIVLLGLGFALQEKVSQQLKQELDKGVLIGEGGSFDYREFGGKIARSPGAVQYLHLEWLWRLAREPSRIKRQIAIPRFMWAVYRHKRKLENTLSRP